MFGKNPKRPPEKGDGTTLKIQDIFPTLQGEGPHTGRESVFIRLGGCNLACHFCDTEFENFREMSLTSLLQQVQNLSAAMQQPLIVITGGEPFRQNITPLCEALIAKGLSVQIETNGLLWRDLPAEVEIICSPKIGAQGYLRPDPRILQRLSALKVIISANAPYDHIPDYAAPQNLWLQPMDEYDASQNQRNLEHCLKLAEAYHAKVSLQTHKLFALD